MNVLEHFQDARNVINVASGAVIFKEGAPATTMYVVLEGAVEVTVGDTVVEVAERGALVGEMALVDASPRSATVVAATPCRLIAIDAKQFDLLVRETPQFARHVMAVLVARLRRMNERLTEAATELNVHVETRRLRAS